MTESVVAMTECLDHECWDHDLKLSADKINDATGWMNGSYQVADTSDVAATKAEER